MLSVIIPTLNEETHLPRLLAQLRGKADDIVITDGGSTDRTLKIALDGKARLALGCPGRGWQLARGAGWSRGDWLLFLHADVRLAEGWERAVDKHMKAHPDKAGYFRFRVDDKGIFPRVMEFFVAARCRLFALPYGDQGLLISRDLYEQIGGFPGTVLFEDVAILRALGRKRIRQLPANIYTDTTQYKNQGYFRRGFRNLGLLARYFLGAKPEALKDDYYK